jgi:hypothetical protein
MSATRYEVKMTCEDANAGLPRVRAWLRLHPAGFSVAYPPRRVNNLYLDTPELASLQDHRDGAFERSKLRFRWYGDDNAAVRGSLELKSKSSRVGWKEICPIPVCFDLTAISWREWMAQLRANAKESTRAWLTSRDRPTLLNSYVREYYESADRQVRLTLDHSLVAYEQVLHAAPNLALPVPGGGRIVMEIKAAPDLYRRVSDVLSSFPLPAERHSKYVDGLLDALSF